LEAVGVRDDVTLVLHDWGSALGFDWARRHPGAVRAIAYMEAIVRPFPGWEHWSEKSRGIFQALRSAAGKQMLLDENLFVEKILPMAVLRDLTDAEMAEYRRPFAAPGDDRLPTLVWPRQLPIAGAPADVVEICDGYAEWLAATPGIPKLFFNVEPGAILIGAQREFCRTWPDETEVTVAGLHFVQEDSGRGIGRMIADWLTGIR
jgi:haloalkane dehalogenase